MVRQGLVGAVRSTFLAALLLSLGGCSIFLAPDNDDLGPPLVDGGDGDADAGDAALDGGVDAGPDAGCIPRPEDCNDMTADLDCDGFRGCADLDCASAALCCMSGDRFILASGDENWAAGYDSRWFLLPSASGISVTASAITFASDAMTHGLLFAGSTAGQCAPLAFGFQTDVTFVVGTSVPGDFAAVELTHASTLGPLLPDLEVSLESDNMVHARTGATDLAAPIAIPAHSDGKVNVRIEVSPGALDGRSLLLATIRVGALTSSPVVPLMPFVQGQPFVDASTLLSPAACHGAVPGLNYLLTGRGSSVRIGTVAASTLACANPSQFTGGAASLDPTALQFMSFADGGLGAPALAAYGMPLPTFDLFTDASHDPRGNELIAPVHFSIGHASAAGAASWPPPIWMNHAPGMGAFIDDPTFSRREPTVLVTSTAPVAYTGFFAEEVSPRVYDLYRWDLAGGTVTTGMAAALAHGDVPLEAGGTCDSLRDPAIARDSRNTAGQPIYLFFTCEHGTTSDIRAVLLDSSTFMPMGDPVLVLSPAMATPYGANGVRGPEPLIRFDPTSSPNVRVRLYFIARSAAGDVLAMAQGQGDHVVDLPPVSPFPGNPLLRGDEASLGGCAAGNTCEIKGLGLVRDPSTATGSALRIILARRVDSPTAGSDWQLLPLTQTLETFW